MALKYDRTVVQVTDCATYAANDDCTASVIGSGWIWNKVQNVRYRFQPDWYTALVDGESPLSKRL